jgi:hypothetical protein
MSRQTRPGSAAPAAGVRLGFVEIAVTLACKAHLGTAVTQMGNCLFTLLEIYWRNSRTVAEKTMRPAATAIG